MKFVKVNLLSKSALIFGEILVLILFELRVGPSAFLLIISLLFLTNLISIDFILYFLSHISLLVILSFEQ